MNEFIQQTFKLMRDWHWMFQFAFLLLVAFGTLITVLAAWRLFVVLIRGWPPVGTPDAEADEPRADDN